MERLEKLWAQAPKPLALRCEELLRFSPSGNDLEDLFKIMEITAEYPALPRSVPEMTLPDILMALGIIKARFTAEREVTEAAAEKLEEIVEFYRLKAAERC